MTADSTEASEEKQRLIQRLASTRQRSIARLHGVNERALVHPDSGWRVQDLLGHLAAWEREMLAAIQSFAEGDRYEPGDELAVADLYNEAAFQRRRDFDAAQCRMDWGMVRRDIQFAIAEFPSERLDERLRFPWGAQGTLAELIAEMVSHEEEHMGEIAAALDLPPQ